MDDRMEGRPLCLGSREWDDVGPCGGLRTNPSGDFLSCCDGDALVVGRV